LFDLRNNALLAAVNYSQASDLQQWLFTYLLIGGIEPDHYSDLFFSFIFAKRPL